MIRLPYLYPFDIRHLGLGCTEVARESIKDALELKCRNWFRDDQHIVGIGSTNKDS
jgi:hypothetical protein